MSKAQKLNEMIKEASGDIAWDDVKEAGMNVAKDIFDEPDESIIDDMIETIKNKHKPKSTEDAIQIITNMLRDEE